MKSDVVTPKSRRRRWRSRVVLVLCWGYLLLMVCFLILVRRFGDREWHVTLAAFAPRAVVLIPLVFLVPLAVLLQRRMLVVLGIAAGIAVFPVMGFCVSYRHFAPPVAAGLPLRVMAFNCHSDLLREPIFAQYLSVVRPDVVCVEEMPTNYNHRVFPRSTWNLVQHDELFLASRYPIISAHDMWRNAMTKFGILTPAGEVEVIVAHLSSPHFALRDALLGREEAKAEILRNIRYRTIEAGELAMEAARSGDRPLIIAGDFNLVPDSPLLAGRFAGMTDSFEATGLGFGWTYNNGYTLVRIDRVLSNSCFTATGFSIGPKFQSPHRPIVADLVLMAK